MKPQSATTALCLATLALCAGTLHAAAPIATKGKIGDGTTITAVTANDDATPQTVVPFNAGFPRPPLLGYSPLVVMTLSDEKASDDFDFEHDLHYLGVDYLSSPPTNDQFVIGLFDSGAVIDLIPEPFATSVGLTGARMSLTEFPIGGASGQIDATISYPLALFANGLGIIQQDGTIDTSELVGHSNVCILKAPEISCSEEDQFRPVVGTPLLSFFTTSITHSNIISIDHDGQTYISPDVQMSFPHTPSPATYPHQISMELGGLEPATTASFYALPITLDDLEPFFPTMLSLSSASFPFGGTFFSTLGVLEGEPGPLNPIQNLRMLVDTGAQTSVISPAVAANLSLPLEPDFEIEVCGIGGISTAPGYYIDYVRINAGGGAIEFANAPFVVMDLMSPEGTPLDGIIGMNLFWNRDVVFDPTLLGSSFLHVSAPFDLPYGDFDRDTDVDADDYATFVECASGAAVVQLNPLCIEADADGDFDVDQADFGIFQICLSGAGNPADPACDD